MNLLTVLIVIFVFFGLLFVLLFEFTGLLGAPYVPSSNKDIKTAFTELYTLSGKDLLVDLGSGDGKVLRLAEKNGAKVVGVEINPVLALFSKIKYSGYKNIHVYCGDMYKYKLPKETTVVYVYGNTRVVKRLYSRLMDESKRLGKKLYFITNAFDCKNVAPVKQIAPYYLYEIKSPDL